MITKAHHYFMLSCSPWPLLSSISSFNLLFSIVIFFKFGLSHMLLLSLIFLTLISFMWWMNYKKEFNFQGYNSSNLELGVKMSMLLFISSEVFFFFSFFWSYFHFFLSPTMEMGMNWPPNMIIPFEALNVPFLNTLILLSSGLTVTISHFFLNKGYNKLCLIFLLSTITLGGIFTFFQYKEYCSSFFSINDGTFGTSFFMLTGFHGLHVLIGTIFLSVTLLMSLYFSSSKLNFLSFELACWYWHFVDVVWIFLFFFLYYLNE